MKFTEYEKMALSLEKFHEVDKLKKNSWIVTEKVHGANFSCHTDGKQCIFARRRDFLKENEAFYNFKTAEFMRDFQEKVVTIFGKVCEYIDGEIAQVIIFGELFGGKYDHPDVGKRKGKPVQAEIQYSPDIRFMAFDIAYRKADENGMLCEQEFLDYSISMEIFESFDIFYAKPLFTGNLSEAMNYPIGFDSTVPTALGLPGLPKGSNVAEGIVVRPLKNLLSVDAFGDSVRVMVKIKVPEFDETRKQPGNKIKGTAKPGNRPDKELIPIMLKYITENRMVSAAVKTGHPENEEIEKEIKEEFMQDVMNEMLDDEGNLTLWNVCDDKQKEAVRKCLTGKTHGLLMKYKAKIKDKE